MLNSDRDGAKVPISLDQLCDGRNLFTRTQAAKYLDVHPSRVSQLMADGQLHPGRLATSHGADPFYTLADLEAHKNRGETLEAKIFAELKAGRSPVDIVIDLRVKPTTVGRATTAYAKLSRLWLIETPRGSYGRWLEGLGLAELTPRQIRRVIELLVSDPGVQAKAELALGPELKRAAG